MHNVKAVPAATRTPLYLKIYISIPATEMHNNGMYKYVFLQSYFICNLYQYIQQIVQRRIQWHREDCSVALLCN
jgi:hypothetical protein